MNVWRDAIVLIDKLLAVHGLFQFFFGGNFVSLKLKFLIILGKKCKKYLLVGHTGFLSLLGSSDRSRVSYSRNLRTDHGPWVLIFFTFVVGPWASQNFRFRRGSQHVVLGQACIKVGIVSTIDCLGHHRIYWRSSQSEEFSPIWRLNT